ncbi:MAG: VOC family protein [Rhodospirillales bacterium]|nr:VOC family protein [Rhodospirillales bacterium]
MQIQPYLFFDGSCDEAIAFYRDALGATPVMRLSYRDAPEPMPVPPEMADKVMHARLEIGGAVLLMSDACGVAADGFKRFSLTLPVPTEAEADRLFAALRDAARQVRGGLDRDRRGIGAARRGAEKIPGTYTEY